MIKRRKFLNLFCGGLLATLAPIFLACDGFKTTDDDESTTSPTITGTGDGAGDGDGDDGGGDVVTNSCTNINGGVTYLNITHPHDVINLTAEQIDTATPGNYMVLMTGHQHVITMAPQDFASLKSGVTINKTTVGGNHTHNVSIACA